MPEQDRRSAEKAERAKGLHEAMADAAAWFIDKLNGIEGAEARNVLKRRGITEEIARSFGLGFAPDSRGKLKEALKGYGDAMLVEAGMHPDDACGAAPDFGKREPDRHACAELGIGLQPHAVDREIDDLAQCPIEAPAPDPCVE